MQDTVLDEVQPQRNLHEPVQDLVLLNLRPVRVWRLTRSERSPPSQYVMTMQSCEPRLADESLCPPMCDSCELDLVLKHAALGRGDVRRLMHFMQQCLFADVPAQVHLAERALAHTNIL